MKYIVVVECASSGFLYVDEIISRGYTPYLIYPPADAKYANMRNHTLEAVKGLGVISFPENYEAALNELKGLEIGCVVPGSDFGILWAEKLAKDLGLPGNNPETNHLRCTKHGMYTALKKAGIRAIESRIIRSEKDISEFWDEFKLEAGVVKYSSGAGTVGLKICSSKQEAIDHFKLIANQPNIFGQDGSDILIQEYIGGDEFIVNTVSRDGKHLVTDVWTYNKIRDEDGTLMYDSMLLVPSLSPGHQELIRYAYQVLDAVDIKTGVCHSEIKIDSKGPVLIETNPRPMGASMTPDYLDEILGHHVTDIALDAYMIPEAFMNRAMRLYRPLKFGMMKFVIIPKDLTADMAPLLEIAQHLPGFRKLQLEYGYTRGMFKKTVDLETSPLFIKFCGTTEELIRSYNFLHYAETKYFDILFMLKDSVKASDRQIDQDTLLAHLNPSMKYLLITDDGAKCITDRKVTDVGDQWCVFDGCVYAEHGENTVSGRFRNYLMAASMVRSGGYILVLPEAYAEMPHGSAAMELVVQLSGAILEVPPCGSGGILIGRKL